MAFSRLILLGLLGLVVAEAAVFLLAMYLFGTFAALFASLTTSLIGMLVLGRMGKRLAGQIADMLSRRDLAIARTGSSGALTMIGGILLVLPGFITDLAGLLLLVPAVQKRLIDRSAIGRPRSSGRVLDLDRSQWRDMPDKHITDDKKTKAGKDRLR